MLKKERVLKNEFVPFSVSELIKRIEMSEKDIKNGNCKTQDELEKISAS